MFCNFVYDCPHGVADEATCPQLFTFDGCEDLESCFWNEAVEDDLDWRLATVAEAGESGPHNNIWEEDRDGKFLMIQNMNQQKSGTAEVISPIYRDSGTDCYIAFYVYINSSESAVLYPELRQVHQDQLTVTRLDRLDSEVIVAGQWTKVEVGVGRQRAQFSLGFSLHHGEAGAFSGAVAVDNFNLFDCTAGPPPQPECYQYSLDNICI